MRKVIIEVRANERALRTVNRHIPWTPAEIADDGKACIEAGAAIIHFHGRSADGASVEDFATYRESIAALRATSPALIHTSLGDQAVQPLVERRYAVILQLAREGLAPDLAPIGMAPSLFSASPETEILSRPGAKDALRAEILRSAVLLKNAGVTPYFDIWNMRAMRRAVALLDDNLLGPDPVLMLSMVDDAALNETNIAYLQRASREGLNDYLQALPRDRSFRWTTLCSGGNLLPLIPRIVELGGNISIGLGDYPYPELGLPTNAELVRHVVRLLRSQGVDVASPEEARETLNLCETGRAAIAPSPATA